MKLNFVENKYYTCYSTQKRSEDLIFELGKRYKCVLVTNEHKFSQNYIDDRSTVKFITHDGVICSFFGIDALKHFTDNNDVIKNIMHNNENKINLIDEEINKLFDKVNELKIKRGNMKTINDRLNLNLKLKK